VNSGAPSGIRRALGWLPSSPTTGRDALQRVRGASMRVALISTAIVAAVYLVISVTVAVIVTSRLTGDVDAQMRSTLDWALAYVSGSAGPSSARNEAGTQFIWVIDTFGQQYSFVSDVQDLTNGTASPTLPGSEDGISAAQTISLGGNDYRAVGADVPGQPLYRGRIFDPGTGQGGVVQFNVARVVVAESMASVSSATSNIVLAEAIIGPILLVAVFLGALAVGRRVAAPIELTRIRQLEFTADASHELRTPLAVIEAQTSLALTEPRDSDWYRSAFQRVQGETGRIRRLVEDLLWLARFDSTRSQAQAEHVDVAILAHQAADRFTAIAEAKHVRLTVRTAPVPLIVHAPPEWLDRLLAVLLDNACKYVPEGGAIDVSVWAEGNRIRLNVDDNGPGIPAEERPRIFDRFHRATDRASGAGLGLAIADAVVRATAGRWLVGDSPAGGASMGVIWPRSLTGSPEPGPVTREAPTPAL
jgi:two-component system, OmpR family, sensor histidine kinase CiaH